MIISAKNDDNDYNNNNNNKKIEKKEWNNSFIVIIYAIVLLRYLIFYKIYFVIREILSKKYNTNIKYSIFKYKINTSNIKYLKLC